MKPAKSWLIRCLCLPLAILTIMAAHREAAQSADSKPEEIDLSIIVVRSLDEAHQVLDRLNLGENFRALASEKSIDPTANAGGRLGKVDPAGLRPELREALRGIAPGHVTPVVRIPEGYAILQVMGQTNEQGYLQAPTPGQGSALSATGSVKYGPDVSGFSESVTAVARRSKAAGWNQDLQEICKTRTDSVSDLITRLRFILDPSNSDARLGHSPMDIVTAHQALAQLYAYQGDMDPAIEQYDTAWRLAATDVPPAAPQLEESLAAAYLHRSEMINGVYRLPGDRCLFPMGPAQAFAKTADSERAVQLLLDYLKTTPEEPEVQWLLNVAYMTLGKYPSGVPEKYLIPPSAFASAEQVGRFIDVAPQAGLLQFSMAGGTIVDDFSGDGLLDVVTSSQGSCDPMHYFHNNGDGTFTDRAAHAGLSAQLGGLNIMQTDYNNDGCLDILVLRGGWELSERKSLLRNNCDGTFTDVTAASGLAVPATSTQNAVWADVNNDGWLDLFVGNENSPAQLFLNKRDGTFEDVSHAAHVDGVGFSKGVAAADYDNDGFVDLYVSNLAGPNFLYHNNHDGTFTEEAMKAGVPGPGRGFATWFFDYDNDGWPDLFVTSYFYSVDETARTYLGLPHNATTLKLYRNLGNGTFRDVTSEVGLDKVFMPMGSNFGDIDNDGFLDIYLGTGSPSYTALVPNVLLRNDAGRKFVDVTTSSGTGELHKGHGVAFADIDRDGDEDLLEDVGGAVPGDRHAFRLFENPGNGNDWINLKLVGVKTNRAAIGARIKVTVSDEGGPPRSIYRTVGSGGSFGASPLEQHIGLGKSAEDVSVEIWWPVSGTRQTFRGVGKNQFLEIKEFASTYAKLNRPSFHLGGAGKNSSGAPSTVPRESVVNR